MRREDVEEGNLQRDAAEKLRRNPKKRETNRGRALERGGMKMNDTQKEGKRSHGIGEVKGRGEERRVKGSRKGFQKVTDMTPERDETDEVIERKEMRGTEESETAS